MAVYRFARTMQLGRYDGDEIITVQMARVIDAGCGIAAVRPQMIGQTGEIIAETAIGGGNLLGAQHTIRMIAMPMQIAAQHPLLMIKRW